MASFALELVGVLLSVVGLLLGVTSCALPMWRVSAFIGANIITAQAARALSVLSIVAGVVGLLIATVGAKCTNCIVDEGAKARAMVASGATFLLAALAQLVPASWSAHSIVQEFYNPLVPSSQKMEIGAALYLGWAAASLLVIGGSILCASCPPPREENTKRYFPSAQSGMAYSAAPRSVAQSSYPRKDYV
ncbi:unnamed protein product [Arctogadus glacialis]